MNVLEKMKKRVSTNPKIKLFNFKFPQNNIVTKRIRDILEDDVDEKYYLSEEKTLTLLQQLHRNDSVKSDSCDLVGLLNIKGNETVRRVYSTEGVSPTLTTMGGGNREPKIAVIGNVNPSGNGMNGAVYNATGLCPTLTTNKGEGVKIAISTEVRPVLTPDRLEKRQNGRRFKDNDEESFTLTAQDKHGVAIGVYPSYRIRKLTPLECWRLQGFSDEAFYTVQNAGISNSQLYKQAGNAVTVNVIEAIATNLIPLLHVTHDLESAA